jgi:hypothetical protein
MAWTLTTTVPAASLDREPPEARRHRTAPRSHQAAGPPAQQETLVSRASSHLQPGRFVAPIRRGAMGSRLPRRRPQVGTPILNLPLTGPTVSWARRVRWRSTGAPARGAGRASLPAPASDRFPVPQVASSRLRGAPGSRMACAEDVDEASCSCPELRVWDGTMSLPAAPTPPKKPRRWPWVLGALIVGIVGLSILGDAAAIPVTPPAPTVTGISPTSGTTGTSLTITGTNLTGATVTVCEFAASVQSNTGTSLVVIVPAGATGVCTVVVTTPGGSATATAQFTVTGPSTFARSITLNLGHRLGRLVARGFVTSNTSACVSGQPIWVQRKRVTDWHTLRRTLTLVGGKYTVLLPDRMGRYRAVAPRLVLIASGDVCARAVSNVARNGRVLRR